MARAPWNPNIFNLEPKGRSTPWHGLNESKGASEGVTALPSLEPKDDPDRSTLSSFTGSTIKAKREWESDKPDAIQGAEDIVTKVLHAEDDPSLNPCTFRMWFIGESVKEY